MAKGKSNEGQLRPSAPPPHSATYNNKTCTIVLMLIWLLTFTSLALNSFERQTRQAHLFSTAIVTSIDLEKSSTRK